MQDPNNTLLRTVPLLQALQARLQALTWTAPGQPPQPAFARVLIHDLRDLAAVVREMLAFDDRICLIVYEGDRWSNRSEGTQLLSELTRDVTLIVSDRQLGDRPAALLGGHNNPGAYLLGDLVAEALRGPLALPPKDAAGAVGSRAWMQPVEGRPLLMAEKDREELTGRGGKIISLEIRSGTASAYLGYNRL
jgi:hypothetical protein